MAIWIVAVLLLIVGSEVLSQYAHRRVRRGDSRFGHLVYAPRLVIFGLLVAVGILLSFELPLVGIPYTLGALVLLGAWLRAGKRVVKSIRPGMTEEETMVEVGDTAVEPMALYGVLVLVGGFLAVIGLIVFGVAERL